jgi:hypothetical protein
LAFRCDDELCDRLLLAVSTGVIAFRRLGNRDAGTKQENAFEDLEEGNELDAAINDHMSESNHPGSSPLHIGFSHGGRLPMTWRLRVRQIVIVDEKGTERVWIGAPVPDPIIQGQLQKRQGPVSGVILLDAKGNVRRAGNVIFEQPQTK